jgi:hypothetical protein
MKLTCEHGARPIDLDSVVEVIWAATDLVFSQAAYQNVSQCNRVEETGYLD